MLFIFNKFNYKIKNKLLHFKIVVELAQNNDYSKKGVNRMENEKQERFHRVAAKRTNRVLNDLRLLSGCANRNNYSYTDAEVAEMFSAIDNALRSAKASFQSGKKKTSFSFRDNED